MDLHDDALRRARAALASASHARWDAEATVIKARRVERDARAVLDKLEREELGRAAVGSEGGGGGVDHGEG